MIYDNYTYLYPPRPDRAIDSTMLPILEKRGWIAQTKFNGQCSLIFISPNGSMATMNRHNEPHRSWEPTQYNRDDFGDLPPGWYVFVAELIHNKINNPHLKNINYVHDILVLRGEYLVGKSQEDRQNILQDLLLKDDARDMPTHYEVSSTLWVTKEYESGFAELYREFDAPEHEGLVLKDPKQKLKLCSRAKSNTGGLLKCRRHHKNYSF